MGPFSIQIREHKSIFNSEKKKKLLYLHITHHYLEKTSMILNIIGPHNLQLAFN